MHAKGFWHIKSLKYFTFVLKKTFILTANFRSLAIFVLLSMDKPYINIHTHDAAAQSDCRYINVRNISINAADDIPNDQQLCSAGLHPWYLDAEWALDLPGLSTFCEQDQVIAIGECGLDKVSSVEFDMQKKAFEAQINLANQLQKPLIIHCVKAYDEVHSALKSSSVPVIFHGFNKHKNLGTSLLQKGYYLSLGHAILSGKMDEFIQSMPLHLLFLETDMQKDSSIADIYIYIANRRDISLAELQFQMEQNFERVFGVHQLNRLRHIKK